MRGFITIISLAFAAYSMSAKSSDSLEFVTDISSSQEQINEVCKEHPYAYFCPLQKEELTNNSEEQIRETANAQILPAKTSAPTRTSMPAPAVTRSPEFSTQYTQQMAWANYNYYQYMRTLTQYMLASRQQMNQYMLQRQSAYDQLLQNMTQIYMGALPIQNTMEQNFVTDLNPATTNDARTEQVKTAEMSEEERLEMIEQSAEVQAN